MLVISRAFSPKDLENEAIFFIFTTTTTITKNNFKTSVEKLKPRSRCIFLFLPKSACQKVLPRSADSPVGNGLKIKVGIDPIAGPNSQYFLSEELREYLTDLGIIYLA